MEISDVRVRLVKDASERLKAVCSVTLDGEFVIRDVKLVEGTGGLFVAMPSRKLSAPCPQCRTQNHFRAKYCNECGAELPAPQIPCDENGREKAHRDVAHPITTSFRQLIQERVLEAYRAECEPLPKTDDAQAMAESDRDSEPDKEVSEYDAMIADLREGGAGDRTTDRQEAPVNRASGRQRRGRGGRDRRDSREHELSRSAGKEHAVVGSSSTPQPDSAILPEDQTAPVEAEEEDEVASVAKVTPGAPTHDDGTNEPDSAATVEAGSGPPDPIKVSEEADRPPDSDDASDDSTPFGDGIL